MPNLVSKCCNAVVILQGGITESSTCWHECAKCHQPTDAMTTNQRPTRSFKWEIPKDEPPKAPRLTIPQAKAIADRARELGLISFPKPMSASQIQEQLSRAKMMR